MKDQFTFLCVSCEYKGEEFLIQCKHEGHRVLLLTGEDERERPWPMEYIDEVFYIQANTHCLWDEQELRDGMAALMQHETIDVVVALDDFDVERVAMLREEFRIPGMGRTTASYFRDKLSMRIQAKDAGIPVPAFTPLFNDAPIHAFVDKNDPPWMLKPRKDAGAVGVQKIKSKEQLWEVLSQLGNRRYKYLLEAFKPGNVFHVDSISSSGKILFTRVSKYLSTPFEVSNGGGIFRSITCQYHGEEDKALRKLNADVMKAFGMRHSASHSEFIQDAEGNFYFLETASRVGGANLGNMVEAASGVNPWSEWARLESSLIRGETYQLPETRRHYSGIIASLSRFPKADYSHFDDPEVVWTMNKEYHVGLIVSSPDQNRVMELLDKYAEVIHHNYSASLPPKDITFG